MYVYTHNKGKLSLCLGTTCNGSSGSGSTAARILFGVSGQLRHQQLYRKGKRARYTLEKRPGGPHSKPVRSGKQKSLCHGRESNLVCAARRPPIVYLHVGRKECLQPLSDIEPRSPSLQAVTIISWAYRRPPYVSILQM